MIISKKYHARLRPILGAFFLLKSFLSFFVFIFYYLIRIEGRKTKFTSHAEYPRLKGDAAGNSSCISCFICSDLCPVDAIEIVSKQKNRLLPNEKMDSSNHLTSGTNKRPDRFDINYSLCIQCSQCIFQCPVSALTKDFTSEYNQA